MKDVCLCECCHKKTGFKTCYLGKVKVIYKNIGETPLEALERFRADHVEYKNEPMTYAGRLDPMASGKLIILIGEECKNKDEYLKLDKEYEVDILLGADEFS